MAQITISRNVYDRHIGWHVTELPIEWRPWQNSDNALYTVVLWDYSHFPDVRVVCSFEKRSRAISFCRSLGFDKSGAPIAYVGKGSYGQNDSFAVTNGVCCDYNPRSIIPSAIKIRVESSEDRALANAASARTQLKAWDWEGLR